MESDYMNASVSKALSNIDESYESLIEVANDIFNEVSKDVDKIMSEAYNNIEMLNNDIIRDLMLKLSLRSYSFSEIKERATFKAVLGEVLRKEAYADNFNKSEGTVATRENTATIESSAEILAEEIYTMVANMLKAKLDELHRIVSTLQSVLMTRMQEAKLSSFDVQ